MFAVDMDNQCDRCLEILRRDSVAEGHMLKCLRCPYGVKVVLGKRVLKESDEINNTDNSLETPHAHKDSKT